MCVCVCWHELSISHYPLPSYVTHHQSQLTGAVVNRFESSISMWLGFRPFQLPSTICMHNHSPSTHTQMNGKNALTTWKRSKHMRHSLAPTLMTFTTRMKHIFRHIFVNIRPRYFHNNAIHLVFCYYYFLDENVDIFCTVFGFLWLKWQSLNVTTLCKFKYATREWFVLGVMIVLPIFIKPLHGYRTFIF